MGSGLIGLLSLPPSLPPSLPLSLPCTTLLLYTGRSLLGQRRAPYRLRLSRDFHTARAQRSAFLACLCSSGMHTFTVNGIAVYVVCVVHLHCAWHTHPYTHTHSAILLRVMEPGFKVIIHTNCMCTEGSPRVRPSLKSLCLGSSDLFPSAQKMYRERGKGKGEGAR